LLLDDVVEGIHPLSAHLDDVVHVRAGAETRASHGRELLAASHVRTGYHERLLQMAVVGAHAEAVIHHHRDAKPAFAPGEDHPSRRRGKDRRPELSGDVDAIVKVALAREGRDAVAKARSHPALRGPGGRRRGEPLALSAKRTEKLVQGLGLGAQPLEQVLTPCDLPGPLTRRSVRHWDPGGDFHGGGDHCGRHPGRLGNLHLFFLPVGGRGRRTDRRRRVFRSLGPSAHTQGNCRPLGHALQGLGEVCDDPDASLELPHPSELVGHVLPLLGSTLQLGALRIGHRAHPLGLGADAPQLGHVAAQDQVVANPQQKEERPRGDRSDKLAHSPLGEAKPVDPPCTLGDDHERKAPHVRLLRGLPRRSRAHSSSTPLQPSCVISVTRAGFQRAFVTGSTKPGRRSWGDSMPELLRAYSPIDGSLVAERPLAGTAEVRGTLAAARAAQAGWRASPLAERAAVVERFCQALLSRREEIARELTRQMGRPVRYTPLEVDRLCERARYMAQVAEEALAPLTLPPLEGLRRFIRREPLGTVLTIAPWNYPYLTAVNSVVPAILAGNAVVLKHSAQTPLCAERFAQAFQAAGLPNGVFQVLHLSHEDTDRAIRDPGIDFVAFTGSIEGGSKVQQAAAERFIGVNLELGGKDPAYVRADANLGHAIENLVDGAFFNSGQSCCGIERIYVHERVYDDFVEGAVALVKAYVLGNPLEEATTLGPMVRASAADFVRDQIAQATHKGARALVDPKLFPLSAAGTPYLAPQVLVDVDHRMRVMTEESFGPVVGIMRVRSDDEAVRLMNDSPYGLTAAIWTEDPNAAIALGERLETGTFFMNRCDYLDPALAWTGVKNSGRGCTLSRLGFEQLTRPKSFHLRVRT